MAEQNRLDALVGDIESYLYNHDWESTYEITFPEGDVYRCVWENGEYVDNDEELDSPEYEEWYELDFRVLEVVKEGPNKDPRYDYVMVSRKRMPSLVTCGGKVVYRAERGAHSIDQETRLCDRCTAFQRFPRAGGLRL